ncbi:hypothetical protein HG537_0G02310 [Torulaspora globosa]|uniref:F-box domain-containing protein n=1 Tax=Torulaspora globosa TaxID=48254 RepID=A0A7H9HYP7_9SACH|nr:hypothetical protein HG537_0G02310 [Torulaspora sp. CBS 2947]
MEETVIDKALDLGTTYFRNQSYDKAKELFRKALELARSYDEKELIVLREGLGLPRYTVPEPNKHCKVYHPMYVRLLDNLAATYEKLNDLKRALRSAQMMIEADPYNLKCYIRVGKILQKQSKDKDAYNVYVQGLRKAREAHQRFSWPVSKRLVDIAQQQKNNVKTRLEPEKTGEKLEKRHLIDPIEERKRVVKKSRTGTPDVAAVADSPSDLLFMIPPELYPIIFESFTAKELFRVTLVCKSWRKSLLEFPQLFRKFILNSCSHQQLITCCNFMLSLYKIRRGSLETFKFSSKYAKEELKSVETIFSKLSNFHFERLILSVPNCTTSHLAKLMRSNTDICKELKDLSLVLSFRAGKPYEIEMLSQCRNLRRLEVLVDSSVVPVDSGLQRSSSFIEPRMLPTWAENLESFSLTCDQSKVRGFPFLTLVTHFPANQLSRLSITGVTFSSEANQFDWLANFDHLREIWFENNKGASLMVFMRVLRDYPLSRKLEKLTFREDCISGRTDLEETSDSYFYRDNLQHLREIDLMGSSISGLGISRLLSYLQPNNIRVFNLGDCPFIKLQRTQSSTDCCVLSPYHFLISVPYLESFLLPQLGALNDDTMKLFTQEVGNLENLKNLDLSLNPSITGVSLFEFLTALKETRSIPLEYLNIDGCPSISHITVKLLENKSLVQKVDCIFERETWRRFGVNSLKYKS